MAGKIDIGHERDEFIRNLQHGKIRGSSYDVASGTVRLLRRVIAHGKFATLDDMLNLVRKEGTHMSESVPMEFVVSNMTAKVLKLIREEYIRLLKGTDDDDPHESLNKLWSSGESSGRIVQGKELRAAVIESLGEFLQELEVTRENIASQALNHIQNGDCVLTLGDSLTVEAIIKEAARKRQFSVIVVENGPSRKGREVADRLRSFVKKEGKTGEVTISAVGDEWCFAKMTKVSKVILGAYSVLADGGFIAPSGVYSLCLSAKYYSVPVIVCSSFYKLTPKFLSAEDQDSFNVLASPRYVIPYSEGDMIGKVDVYNPVFDCIPPELVSLYLTHASGNAPSYIYRLINEHYHPEDWIKSSSDH